MLQPSIFSFVFLSLNQNQTLYLISIQSFILDILDDLQFFDFKEKSS